MRRFLFILSLVSLLIFETDVTFGQFQQGKFFIGSDTTLSFKTKESGYRSDTGKHKDDKTSEIEIAPQVGYFVAYGLVLGLNTPVNIFSSKSETGNGHNSISWTLGGFFRYYFGSRPIKPFIFGKYGYGLEIIKLYNYLGDSYKFKEVLSNYEFGAGLGFFLIDKVSLDFKIGYNSDIKKPYGHNIDNTRRYESGFRIGYGIILIL